MTTVFHTTLRPILIVSKCFGLIDISYTVEPTGLLVRSTNSTFHVALEITRMMVLLIFTYIYVHRFEPQIHVLQIITIATFWVLIITARLSTIWIIEFINGIIEFDRKITTLSASLLIQQRCFKKKHCDMCLILLFVYVVLFKCLHFYILPLKAANLNSLVHNFFAPPFVLDYTVTISSCFFLQNLYVRFWTLEDIWKCLPADLVAVPYQWTHTDILVLMDNTRLLHSELCDLLNKFSLGYGPLLLVFFTSSFISMLIGIYFIVNNVAIYSVHSAEITKELIIPILMHIQAVTFLMSIIVFVSSIKERRMKIITHLRLYRISTLHVDVKRQIKMFMNQISANELDQITAFGFFNINLNLVTSILVLLITGISTMVQMKDHPIIMKLNNDTRSFLLKLYNINN